MKQKIFTRITSFFLAVCIIVFTSFCCTFPVYASDNSHGGGGGSNHESSTSADDIITNTKKWSNFITCFFANAGAIFVDHDFSLLVQNNQALHDLWNDEHVSIENDTISVDSELSALLKKLLNEYAEQNEPYRIMTTTPFHELPYSSFNNQKNVYDTMKNLIYDSSADSTMDFTLSRERVDGVIYVLLSVSYYADDTDIGYVSGSKTSFTEATGYSFSKWTSQSSNKRVARIALSEDDSAVSSLSEFISIAREHANYDTSRKGLDYYYNYCNFPDSISNATSSFQTPTTFKAVTDTRYALSMYCSYKVTSALEHYRVFATKDDFMDYTLGKRKVYYTSDWYDKEPGSISVDLSKLEDNVSDINKALEKLLDKIDNNTEESKIEELLKQILEELQNGSSGGNSGNTGGSTGGDSSGGGSVDLSGLSGYFESILDYLDKILQLQYIQTITQSEKDKFKEDTEKLLDENKSTFMEIANEMGKKFPFCIPADLAHLFSKLSGSSDAQTQALLNNSDPDYLMAVASGGGSSGGGSSGGGSSGDISLASLGDSEVSVMALDSDSGVSVLRSSMDAPYFELPIIIESFGIDEKIEVDLEPFQPISTFSRSMFSVLFAVALIKFTIHLIPLLSSSTD